MRIAVYPSGGFVAVAGPEATPPGAVYYRGPDLREPRVVDGRVVDITNEELTARAVAERRAERIVANRAEADRRISAVVGTGEDPMRSVVRQLNLLAGALKGVRAEAKGRASEAVVAQLDALEVAYAAIEAVRAAENAASAALDAAATFEDVDAVPAPDWP